MSKPRRAVNLDINHYIQHDFNNRFYSWSNKHLKYLRDIVGQVLEIFKSKISNIESDLRDVKTLLEEKFHTIPD